jgi:xanthine dehydrogenase YagS FAD-binding subunit
MIPFAYGRAASVEEAVAAGAGPGTMFLAGAPNSLTGCASTSRRRDACSTCHGSQGSDRIQPLPGGGLRIGALTA